MDVIIETRELTKVYRLGENRITAVDNLNLKVYRGEVFGLLGPNGSGKTTTILMLLGLIEPTSGEAYVAGFDITRNSRDIRRITGLIPERYSFYEDMSAYRNLRFFAKLAGIPEREIEERIDWSLNFVGLGEWKYAPVKTFSRGMRQRLALANILVKKPEVIFLDEPTSGLDPHATKMFRDLIRKMNRELKITVFICSHLLHEVKQICSRVGFMRNGRLIAVDSIDDLMKKMGYRIVLEATNLNEKVAEEIKGINGVSKIIWKDGTLIIYADRDVRLEVSKLINRLGGYVLTLKIEEPTLEEVFFEIYGGG